jgi:hypothetical protein
MAVTRLFYMYYLLTLIRYVFQYVLYSYWVNGIDYNG